MSYIVPAIVARNGPFYIQNSFRNGLWHLFVTYLGSFAGMLYDKAEFDARRSAELRSSEARGEQLGNVGDEPFSQIPKNQACSMSSRAASLSFTKVTRRGM